MQKAEPFHVSQLKSLAVMVEAEIERQIVAGELAAGDRVNELALSRALGVSRGPIREALQSLRRAGLIELVANRGAVVRRLQDEEALEIYDLRAALFAVMAEAVARHRTVEQVKALKANLTRMDAAVASRSPDDYYRLNLEFHEAIVEMSGMRRAAMTYRDTVKEMHLHRRRSLLNSQENQQRSLGEHRRIVSAIAKGDEAGAFAAARAHVEAGKARFLATLGREEASAKERATAI